MQATSTLTARAPCVKKMTRLLTKLEPWAAVSALLGLISKVQSYARALEILHIYNRWSVPHLWVKFTNDHPTGCAATMTTRHRKQGPSSCLYVSARQAIASHQHSDRKSPMCQKMTRLLAKLEPWTAFSALLGLISKMQSYARA